VPELILPTGEPYAHPGKIAFADNQVDASTGTVAIYADFPNPDHMLLPGQFVTATVVRSARQAACRWCRRRRCSAPATASRCMWSARATASRQRTIKTGASRLRLCGGVGPQEGELVVVSGIQKVKPGMSSTR
jgi:membrane fusion protein (multidrug efflux system)